jgi:hypothetical protein
MERSADLLAEPKGLVDIGPLCQRRCKNGSSALSVQIRVPLRCTAGHALEVNGIQRARTSGA